MEQFKVLLDGSSSKTFRLAFKLIYIYCMFSNLCVQDIQSIIECFGKRNKVEMRGTECLSRALPLFVCVTKEVVHFSRIPLTPR